MEKSWKMTDTMANRYSSESTPMNTNMTGFWWFGRKVALALEGLTSEYSVLTLSIYSNHHCDIRRYRDTMAMHERVKYIHLHPKNHSQSESSRRNFRPSEYNCRNLTFMLLVTNLANTKWCRKPEKWLKPWHMGTHLRVLSESFPMNTNMTGFHQLHSQSESRRNFRPSEYNCRHVMGNREKSLPNRQLGMIVVMVNTGSSVLSVLFMADTAIICPAEWFTLRYCG